MSPYSDLLRRGGEEVREYCRTSRNAHRYGIEWLMSLANRMEAASCCSNEEDIETEIDALAHAITDSGPLTERFAPSFSEAVDVLQRRRKRAVRSH